MRVCFAFSRKRPILSIRNVRICTASIIVEELEMIAKIRTTALLFRFAMVAGIALITGVSAQAEATFQPVATQYIAALGDPQRPAGDDAQTWGIWSTDPGPRSIGIGDYAGLLANSNLAPAGWTFDPTAWWLEEHGRIMETPSFPLPAGQYVVTGGRAVTSLLTVQAPDAAGKQAWSLADGATIHDVTHFGCRAARYSKTSTGEACTPDHAPTTAFPMSPGTVMPPVQGCSKQDYQVLIVVGMMVDG
jgi:hypothetical protein